MTSEVTARALRLWPGVVIVILQWLLRFVVPRVAPEATYVGVMAGMAGGLAIVLWWLFFSRAAWPERVGVVALMIVTMFATPFFLDPSIAKGSMGALFPMLVLPVLSLAFVASVAATRRLSSGLRRASMAAAVLLACGAFVLLRTGGITGAAESDLHWRWTASPEERLLAQADDPAPPPRDSTPATTPASTPAPTPVERPAGRTTPEPPPRPPAVAAAETGAEWPGFRGPERNGVVRGVRIQTDWSASPPVELWRRPIGPGWSSFAAHGGLLYTQEQRGDEEVVASYKLATGEPVWRHRDAVRFWESNAGAGPRGTPTLSHGRVYTLGATGILNALDAVSGARVWSRDAAADTETKVPGWGFSSSPLVVDDLVIVATAGRLAGYDLATGRPRWLGPKHRSGYSSPHLVTVDGVAQVVLMNGDGATSVSPADGKVLWEHALPSGNRVVQPALTGDGDLLISDGEFGDGNHMRRVAIAQGAAGWTVEERWASIALKPDFNDFVVYQGHAFGFDGSILACIDLADGKRKWKGGRYGHGQLVLLPDPGVLLVLSEEGELALVRAAPDQFTELARFPAIEGKTWNHPALAGDVLLVRNGEEMAAFRLPLATHVAELMRSAWK